MPGTPDRRRPRQGHGDHRTTGDIFGEPVVLANYDTNPPAKVTAIGYPGAADLIAGGVVQPSICSSPPTTVGTVARILSNAKVMGDARAHPAHGSDQSGQQRRSAVRRMRPRHRHQHAAPDAQRIGIRAGHLLRRRHPRAADDAGRKPHSVHQRRQALHRRHGYAKDDVAPATTKEAEAVVFDRFAACIKSRPCDRNRCKSRYTKRVAPELASARQADIDLRMTASEARCTEQKEAEAYQDFRSCAINQPCEFDKICSAKVNEALSAETLKKRRTLIDRASTKAAGRLPRRPRRRASGAARRRRRASGWRRYPTRAVRPWSSPATWPDPTPGNGVVVLDASKGKRDRWTGTRACDDDRFLRRAAAPRPEDRGRGPERRHRSTWKNPIRAAG